MSEIDSESNNSEEETGLNRASTFVTENESLDHPDSPLSERSDTLQEITSAQPFIYNESGSELINASENIATHYLEKNFEEGSITGSEMAFYKKRFQLLCDLLQKSRDNEFHLTQLTKKMTLQIERDEALLSQAENYPEDSNTEMSKSRQILLESKNKEMTIEERLATLDYQIVRLQEEKKMLGHDYNRLPGVRNKDLISQLESSIEEFKEEIIKLGSDNRNLSEILKESSENTKPLTEEEELISNEIDSLKLKMVNVNSLLPQTLKSIEKLRKEILEHNDQLESLTTELEKLNTEKLTIEESISKFNIELEHIKLEYSTKEHELIMHIIELDETKKMIIQEKSKENEVMTDKYKIDFDHNTLLQEKKSLHDSLKQKNSVKDNLLKKLKIAQSQMKNSKELLEIITQQEITTSSDYDLYPKSDELTKEHIGKRLKEIEYSKRLFDVQKTLSETEKAKLNKYAQEEERLLYDLSDLRIEAVEQKRLAQIKADEREQNAKMFNQQDKKYNQVIEELKDKKRLIQDLKKSYLETQSRLDAFAKLYNIIQNERNKFANMINEVTQKGSELKEKSRIFGNEIEILKTNLSHTEDLLHRKRTKFLEVISVRDSRRAEKSKYVNTIKEQKDTRDQFQLDIQRLNQLCNWSEESLIRLRNRHDNALRNRNDRAVQLIERNEEVCILQEKYHIKEKIAKAGSQEIHVLEEEIEFLNQEVSECKRQILLMKKKESEKSNYEKELINLKIQLGICQERQIDLEMQVENPEVEKRTRLLGGEDAEPLELKNKIESLELKLTEKEVLIMEKKLLLKAVEKLVEKLQTKNNTSKRDTLELATSLNEYKSEMSLVIKKMKTVTAELTMNMAHSLKLEQEVKSKESQLNEVYRKIENNEFDEEIKSNGPKHIDSSPEMILGDKNYQLTNGIVTTAEPRPNAYIPESEGDLPIPRPYGAHAPFKPSDPGSNMRHIRKQKLKPIEI